MAFNRRTFLRQGMHLTTLLAASTLSASALGATRLARVQLIHFIWAWPPATPDLTLWLFGHDWRVKHWAIRSAETSPWRWTMR